MLLLSCKATKCDLCKLKVQPEPLGKVGIGLLADESVYHRLSKAPPSWSAVGSCLHRGGIMGVISFNGSSAAEVAGALWGNRRENTIVKCRHDK